MHSVSTRVLAALAYERGEEFDPPSFPTPDLMEELRSAMGATPLACEPGPYARRRLRERERRAYARVPDWVSADDLVPDPVAAVHGEPV